MNFKLIKDSQEFSSMFVHHYLGKRVNDLGVQQKYENYETVRRSRSTDSVSKYEIQSNSVITNNNIKLIGLGHFYDDFSLL